MSRFKRIAGIVAGWTFIVLGVAGLFLPFLQGILFLAIGFLILSTEYHWARRLVVRLRTRFPSLDQRLKNWQAKHSRWIGHGAVANEEKKCDVSARER